MTVETSPDTNQAVSAGYADGHVIHDRKLPKKHRFKYHMCWCVFDLDRLDDWFQSSKWWGHNRWSVAALYDQDYVSAEKRPIKAKLLSFIHKKSGIKFDGRVMLFTHPRFMGYGFNSVNFYFCYTQIQSNLELAYIVSEINNTPWGEKHLYLHDCSKAEKTGDSWSFEFDKRFHISPFMEMRMNYRWQFKLSAERIEVKMWIKKQADTLLTVVLDTKITPLVQNKLNRFVLRKPFQPLKMSVGIYWQAFKLWLKKIPFYSHPNSSTKQTNSSNKK